MDTSNLLNVLASPAKVTQEVEIEARLVLRAIVEPRIDASAGDRGAISDPTPSAIRGASRSQAQQRGATTRLSQKPLAGAKSKSAGGTPSSSTPQVGSRPSAGGAEGFAIRLLNQTNQMLSKDAKDLKALTNKDPRRLTGVEAGLLEGYTRCISVTAAASRDLLAVSHRLQLAPLALEMSISNFITRCVETGMGKLVQETAFLLKARLAETALDHASQTSSGAERPRSKPANPQTATSSRAVAGVPQANGLARSAATRTRRVGSIDEAMVGGKVLGIDDSPPDDNLLVPIRCFDVGTRYSVVIISVLLNILRIAVHAKDKQAIRAYIPSLVNTVNGPYAWCCRLYEVDAKTGAPYLQTFYRTMHSASGLAAGPGALRIALVAFKAYAKDTTCDPEKFIESVYRIAVGYDRGPESPSDCETHRTLLDYYAGASSEFRTLASASEHCISTWKILEHLVHLVSKGADSQAAMNVVDSLLLGVRGRVSDAESDTTVLAALAHALVALSLRLAGSSDAAKVRDLTDIAKIVRHGAKTASSKELACNDLSRHSSVVQQLLARTRRSLFAFVQNRVKSHDDDRDSTDPDVYSQLDDICENVESVFNAFARCKGLQEIRPKIARYMVDICIARSQLCLLLGLPRAEAGHRSFEHLRRAATIPRDFALPASQLLDLSACLFNLGVKQYNLESFEVVTACMTESTEILEAAAALQGNGGGDNIAELYKKISKHHEVAGVSFQSLGRHRQAIDAYAKAINFELLLPLPPPRTGGEQFGGHADMRGLELDLAVVESRQWRESVGLTRIAQLVGKYVSAYGSFGKYLANVTFPGPIVNESSSGAGDYVPVADVCPQLSLTGASVPGLVAIVYELEALYMSTSDRSCFDPQRQALERALDMYGEKSPIRSARCLVELTKLCYEGQDIAAGSRYIERAAGILEGIDASIMGANSALTFARCYAWRGIIACSTKAISTSDFYVSLRFWRAFALLASEKSMFDDLLWSAVGSEILYIANFLRNNMLTALEILFLRLVRDVHLNHETAEGCKVEFIILSRLALAYAGQGLVKNAQRCADDAFSICDERGLPMRERQLGLIAKALCHLVGGDIYNCRVTMDRAKALTRPRVPGNRPRRTSRMSSPSLSSSSSKTAIDSLVLVQATYVYALLALKDGSIPDAMDLSIHGYRLVYSILKGLARRLGSKRQGSDSDDPFMTKPAPQKDSANGIDDLPFEAVSSSHHWELQYWIFKLLAIIIEVYTVQGSAPEVDYFVNHGLGLSAKCDALLHKRHILLVQTDIASRKHMWDKYHEAVDQISSLPHIDPANGGNTVNSLYEQIVLADSYQRVGKYSEAVSYYSKALDLLGLQHQSARLSTNNRRALEKRPIQISEALSRLLSLLPECPDDNEGGDMPLPQSTVLDWHRCQLAQRRSLLLLSGQTDPVLTDYDIEDIGNALSLTKERKAEFLLYQAKIKYKELLGMLEEEPPSALVVRSVLLYPSFRKSKLLRPRRATTKYEIKAAMKALEDILAAAVNVAMASGTSNMVHESSHMLATVQGLQLTLGLSNTPASTAESMLNTLESAKHVSVVRAMLETLHNSTKPLPPNLADWPGSQRGASRDGASSPTSTSTPAPHYNRSPSCSATDDLAASMFGLSLKSPTAKSRMDVYAGAETPLVVLDSCALPRTWVVVGVSIDPFVGSIFVTRYQGGRDPCVLRLPLASNDMPPPTNVTNEGTCEMSYAGVLAELRDIIEASDQSMRQGRECETREQKEEWWKNRKQLDDRLGDLLHRIEAAWLGDFKGILANTHIVSECALDEFRQELQHLLVAKWIPKSQVAKCKGLELDVTICQLLLNLSSLLDFASSDLLDACHCILDSYLYQNVALEYEQIDIQQMALDLRELIEKYSKQGHTNADEHIILIVDKYAQQLPWESIPCLRGRAVSRLPSVTFLADRLLAMRVKQQLGAAFRDAADTPPMFGSPSRRHCSTTGPLPASLMLGPADVDLPGLKRVHSQEEKDGEIDGVVVNLRRLYYILNPEGDLSRTQSTFEPFLTRRREWSGSIGRPPMAAECESALRNFDIFLYFGHGGAEHYIKKRTVRQLDRCAVSLLLGCSSGYLRPAGEFDPTGTAINYIIGGCPALLGNLWDVGDKDIDRFSLKLFEEWGLEPAQCNMDQGGASEHGTSALSLPSRGEMRPPRKGTSLVQAANRSRSVCRMPFLTGAAPVVYGIPCYLG